MSKPRQTVVNQRDEVIGFKDRGALTHDDIYEVAALWLTNPKGDVLLAQRKLTKRNDPGKWGPAVAGTVDEGETYQVNIVKEIEEEIGLTNLTLAVGPKELVDDGRYRFFCQWFKAQVDLPIEAFVAQEEEIEAIKWMALRELKADVAKNPDKYTTYMNRWVEILTD